MEKFTQADSIEYEESEIECKRDCYSSNETLLFQKGKKYRMRTKGNNSNVFDELKCIRPIIISGKISDLMKDYFKPITTN